MSIVFLVVVAVSLPTLGRYGYFSDELYLIASGRHLSWGYVDQQPLVPALAWLADTLFPGSLFALRLVSPLALAAGAVVTAQITRELGGAAAAQIVSAVAYFAAFVSTGQLLDTGTLDMVSWTVVTWLVVRWVRLRGRGPYGPAGDDRPLLWAGVVTAVALQVKLLIPMLWAFLLVSALAVGPRDLPRSRMLWLGGAVAVVSAVPGLAWQAAHGWPALAFAEVVAQEEALFGRRGVGFVVWVLLLGGVVAGTLLLCYGLWRLLAAKDLRAYRFLGLAALGVILFVGLTGGRFYHVVGVFPIAWAAGAVRLEALAARRRWWWWVSWPLLAASAALGVMGLPLTPASDVRQPTEEQMSDLAVATTISQFGWPELADSVARAHRALPEPVRRDTVLLAETYWQAGALEVYRAGRGLPAVYSGSRGYWYFGAPPESATAALYVGDDPGPLRGRFGQVRKVGAVEGRVGLEIGTPIWLCEGRTEPWSSLWPRLRRLEVAE
ncbi:ArnT family glycosyltransferase [Sphaerisporangium dianthi]|uniref:ArnT family glycosyltransferase n=1 Tax=Sphaerisporangium dianthi TaxID=1436120 RepID=A0ABV9CNT7_9ACTN